MTKPKVHVPQRNYQKSVCPQPTPSEIIGSSVKGVSVESSANS